MAAFDSIGSIARAAAVSLCAVGTASSAFAAASDAVPRSALEQQLEFRYRDVSGEIRYFAKAVDLNDDRQPEVIVYVAGPTVCGTGGCDTLVFTPEDDGLRLVADIGPGRPPVRVARTITNGWHDLIVHVSGGGIAKPYEARLAFDGTTYPDNPTVAPAQPVAGSVEGAVAIEEFDSFREGQLLHAEK